MRSSQLQFQLKVGYNQTLNVVNPTQNPIQIKCLQITTNAAIPAAWGPIGNQWGNVQVAQDNNSYTYTLTLPNPITIPPGNLDVLTFSVAAAGNKGPFQAAMAPKQIAVQTTGSSDWQVVTAYNPQPQTNPHPNMKFAEYIAQWGIYAYKQGAENAPWKYINSATFCFNGFNINGDVFSLDPNADITQLPLLGMQKQMNPYLDFGLSYGGWTNNGQRMDVIFSQMAANPAARAKFVKNAVNAALITGANGIDIDWEYVEKNDVENFIALLLELRTALPKGAKLTIAAPAGIEKIKNFTPDQWQTVAAAVDEIRIMAYDFFGGFSATSDFHAAWQLSKNSPNYNSGFCTKSAIDTYQQTMGVPAKKLSLGMPNYARAVIVNNVGQYAGLYQPVVGTPEGDFKGAEGIYSWNNIYNLLNHQPSALDQLGVKQWNFYDSNHPLCQDAKMCLLTGQLPNGQWVVLNFLDQASARWRGEQAKQMGFGGTMIWANYSETTNLNNSIAQAVSSGMENYKVKQQLSEAKEATNITNELASATDFLAAATKKEVAASEQANNHAKSIKHAFFVGNKATLINQIINAKTSQEKQKLLADNKAELGRHRNIFKRAISAILPSNHAETFFAKANSLKYAEKLVKASQRTDVAEAAVKAHEKLQIASNANIAIPTKVIASNSFHVAMLYRKDFSPSAPPLS